MGKAKFLFLLGLLSAMTFSFSACSKDDDDTIGSEGDLVGTWESVAYYYQYKENGKVIEEEREADNTVRLKFNADGTCEYLEKSQDEWQTELEGTWIYKGGKLFIKNAGSSQAELGNVKELTSTKLVIEVFDKWKDDGVTCEEIAIDEYRKISK